MLRPIRQPFLRLLVASAAALVMSAGAAQAQDYRPSFHPDTLKGPPAGKVNEVLVLGTTHLSGLPKTFDMALLAPLVDRLAAWEPTGIATEDLSGLQCDALRRYPARYAETVKSYCYDPTMAGQAVGLDVQAANAEVERLLAAWPAQPTAAERRRRARQHRQRLAGHPVRARLHHAPPPSSSLSSLAMGFFWSSLFNFSSVFGPTMPSCSMPLSFWNRRTAFAVSAPKRPVMSPSGYMSGFAARMVCKSFTSSPLAPSRN